jgi:hypothetical protein
MIRRARKEHPLSDTDIVHVNYIIKAYRPPLPVCKFVRLYTDKKEKKKLSSYIRKFRTVLVQSHI